MQEFLASFFLDTLDILDTLDALVFLDYLDYLVSHNVYIPDDEPG